MKSDQQIKATERNGNLHVHLLGHVTPETAANLTSVITQVYRGKGNIFVHTADVLSVAPDSRHVFAECIKFSGLPKENLYLTGKKGLDFNPENIRVIVYEKKKNGCGSRCKNCKCQEN
jgi:hypothetical protein